MNLWATKSITALRAETDETSERSLKRHLGPWGLTALGILLVIGLVAVGVSTSDTTY